MLDSIQLLNTGWLVAGTLLISMVIAPRMVGFSSGVYALPPYTRLERWWLRLQLLDLLAFIIVSVFTPFANGFAWIAAGLAIYVCGAVIYVLALRAFAVTPSGQIVTRGIFQLNRNPIYTGQTLLLLGAGIAGASPLLIALAAGFALLVDRLVRAEERMCAEAFGEAFESYAARVPRWFAWRRPA
jgi:protein-S-isoprenylcysteine O-methyltransferase Ste14